MDFCVTYWPYAILYKENKTNDTISTYRSYDSKEEALAIISSWINDYGFLLKRAWVDIYVDGIKVMEYPVEIERIVG